MTATGNAGSFPAWEVPRSLRSPGAPKLAACRSWPGSRTGCRRVKPESSCVLPGRRTRSKPSSRKLSTHRGTRGPRPPVAPRSSKRCAGWLFGEVASARGLPVPVQPASSSGRGRGQGHRGAAGELVRALSLELGVGSRRGGVCSRLRPACGGRPAPPRLARVDLATGAFPAPRTACSGRANPGRRRGRRRRRSVKRSRAAPAPA